MEITSFAILALLALLIILTGRDAIPIIAFVLNPNAMGYSFDDSFAGQEMISKSSELNDWIRRLQELDFFVLGIKVEKLPLWGGAFREAALVSRQSETYASIVLNRNGTPASLYFYTPFTDGGMVFTRNYALAPEAEGDRISVMNVPSQDFKAILEGHEQRLRMLMEKGLVPLIGSSQSARIEATRVFYESEYSRRHGRYLFTPSVLGLGVTILLFLYSVGKFAFASR